MKLNPRYFFTMANTLNPQQLHSLAIPDLINLPIEQFPFSKSFLTHSRSKRYCTLKNILDIGPERLKQDPNFDYLWYTELIKVLADLDVLYLLHAKK